MAKTDTPHAGSRAWRPLTHVIAPIAALALFAAAPANAHDTSVQQPRAQQAYAAKTQLNLLQQAKSEGSRKVRRSASVGRGSYICSPAGFGQRSRCYAN